MSVDFLNLKHAYLELKDEIDQAVSRVMESGNYILGSEVEIFEHNYANYCGAKYAISVGNGLDALHIALRVSGIMPGDEVIVPAQTFIATYLAVTMCGAKPVPVDIDPRTSLISTDLIRNAITKKTRAIIPVHLYGRPVRMDLLNKIATENNLIVIEDGAQAHGASYDGKKIGSHGNMVAWSFYPGKNLGAFGDGGMITTDDESIANQIKSFRNYGSTKKYIHEVYGVNSRLDPIQAVVLDVKLKYLDDWNLRRESIAKIYNEELMASGLDLPKVAIEEKSAWHLFVVKHDQRDLIIKKLSKEGISSLIHYPTIPLLQSVYKGMKYKLEDFPNALDNSNRVFSLPMGPHLSEDQCKTVCKILKEIVKEL